MEDEETLLPPVEQSSRAEAELLEVIEKKGSNIEESRSGSVPRFLHINEVIIKAQEPMEWELQSGENGAKLENTLVPNTYRSEAMGNRDQRPPTCTISLLPRIPKVKSPIRVIPAGYEDDRKKERKEKQERKADTGKSQS